jgi:hypothetical protein
MNRRKWMGGIEREQTRGRRREWTYTGCPKNGVLTVHYGVEEITVNVRKMLKKFYWIYLLIWRSLKVALNRSTISKYMYLLNCHDSYL